MGTSSQSKAGRLTGLDALRGLASLGVTWFHVSHGGKNLDPTTGWIMAIAHWLGAIGHHGVTLFFVISGYVIPLSLQSIDNDNCNARILSRWIARRLIRLQPPFVIAACLALVLNWLSSIAPGYAGTIKISTMDALTGILNDSIFATGILGRQWILVVAWTLALEVQFYITAATNKCLFKLHKTRQTYATVILGRMLLTTGLGMAFRQETLIFRYLPVFMLGWILADRDQESHPCQIAGIAWAGALIWAWMGLDSFIAGALSLLLVLSSRQWRGAITTELAKLGTISYSLYLVHVPIGGRIVNLLLRIKPNAHQTLLISITATICSIAAAIAFFYYIEKPFHAASRGIRLSGPEIRETD